MDPAPIIAIVGRPNVGKSTLFNRIIGKKQAITAEEAGTTRDRLIQRYELEGYEVLLIDTGGLEYGKNEDIEANIQIQSQIAIRDADLILFVIDSSGELTVDDYTAADILRKSNKPTILIANKCDTPQKIEEQSYNIYELGFGEPVKLSAIHKLGIDHLKNEILKNLKKLKVKKPKKKREIENPAISIVGKPNAGKSSLINSFFNSPKVIVSDIPGTTRDAIDTEINYNEKNYTLIDTAGLRKPGRRERGIEKFSALRTLHAVERSEIVVLVIDGEKSITSQDTHIASHALEGNKGLIIAINKIDLFEEPEEERLKIISRLNRRFAFVPWAPVLFISAKDKKNIFKILEFADEIMAERNKRIPTAELNSFFQKITFAHMPASTKARKPKFFYASQVDVSPPKFVVFMSNAGGLHFTYPRYLENQLRKEFGFNGTAINLQIKNRSAK